MENKHNNELKSRSGITITVEMRKWI